MCKAGSSNGGPRQMTWAEVEQSVPKNGATMNTVSNGEPVYIVINNKVYDLSGDFFGWHPGGAVALSQLGKDATGAFDEFHSETAHNVMSKYYVGDLIEGEIKKPNAFAEDIAKLKDVVEQMNVYDTDFVYYFFKVASTFALLWASLTILWYYGSSTWGVVLSGSVLALFWQQSGWLAHDFLHHQVFTDRKYNNYVGYVVGNLAQGFSVLWWKNKHCTHHSTPNIHVVDPDISTMPFLAWSEHALELFNDLPDDAMARFLVTNQKIIYFPLLMLARLSWAQQSAMTIMPEKAKELMADEDSLLIERVMLVLHWVWYLGVAFAWLTPAHAFLWFAVSQFGCGLLLALVFSLNHNGMPVFTNEESKSMDFYELQIVTGRDVKSSVLTDWFTGGLNYQIEHHMFPTIPRHNLGKISGLVESLCKKHGVVYHKTSFGDGLGEVLGRLQNIARKAREELKKIDAAKAR
ncbi:hypothetical protein HK098_008175 [Nowakowskiella sp. JEL0407]|nr:hypothetical protein HK098_008175 [Nowakowskiella sp. JEL0407]